MSAYKIRKIFKKDARTGEIVTIYPSVEVAAREEGISEKTVYGWCNGSKKATEYRFESEKVKTQKETLCWECRKACGHCSWSREFKPVEGWEATRKDVLSPADGERRYARYLESYIVYRCPEFEPDPPRKLEFPWMTGKCVECGSLLLCASCGPICRKRRDW